MAKFSKGDVVYIKRDKWSSWSGPHTVLRVVRNAGSQYRSNWVDYGPRLTHIEYQSRPNKEETCYKCEGEGSNINTSSNQMEICTSCNGTGKITNHGYVERVVFRAAVSESEYLNVTLPGIDEARRLASLRDTERQRRINGHLDKIIEIVQSSPADDVKENLAKYIQNWGSATGEGGHWVNNSELYRAAGDYTHKLWEQRNKERSKVIDN
jgi:hypothetical protein